MRVYVTGANGFLGSAVTRAIQREGGQVVALGRSAPDIEGVEHRFLDLSDVSSLGNVAQMSAPDAVVHIAAQIGWPDLELAALLSANVIATGLLASAACEWRAPLYFASAAIVHGAHCVSISSDTPIEPDTGYGRSKWLAEELIRASGANHAIFRLGGIFGPGGPKHLGLNAAIDGARRGMRPTVSDAGPAIRSYIFVEDAAAAIVWAVKHGLRGTHLVAGAPPRRIADMLQAVCDRFLPGETPIRVPGGIARNQVIIPSSAFPLTRSFEAALAAIPLPS